MTTDWLDPGTWESIARTAATSVTALAKLRDAVMRRRKTTRKLDEEVDSLAKDLEQLADLMLKQATSHGRFLEAVVRALTALNEIDLVGRAGQFGAVIKAHGDALLAIANSINGLQDAALKHEKRLRAVEQALPKVARVKTQRGQSSRRVTRRK